MRKLIESAPGFFDFYLNRLCQLNDLETDRGRMAVVREMADAVRKTGNAVLTDSVAQKTASRLGVSADSVRAEFRKGGPNRTPPPQTSDEGSQESVAMEETVAPPPARELWLLRLLLSNDAAEDFEWLAMHLDPQWISDGDARCLTETLISVRSGGQWHGEAALLAELESDRQRSLLNDAAMQTRQMPNVGQQLRDVVLQLRNDSFDREMKRLMQRVSSPDLDEAARLDALHRQQALRSLKRQPLQPLADVA